MRAPLGTLVQQERSLDRKSSQVPPLSGSCSVLLDVMRFGAAVTVLLGHLDEPRFSIGLPNLAPAAHLAVAVFFVLSGFVIRYVTLQRETTPGEYLIDRASRIYSVVAPALLLTLFCELAAHSIHPAYYSGLREHFLWRDVPFQFAANLAFQAQNWGYAVYPMSNGPFWSLSFECMYYAIYGFGFFRVRAAKWWILLLLMIGGPSIALMFPVWWMGWLSYDFYRRFHGKRSGLIKASAFFAAVLLLLFIFWKRLLEFLILTNEGSRTEWLSRTISQLPGHSMLFFHGNVPWLAQATPTYLVIGIAMGAFTTWAALVFDQFGLEVPEKIASLVRRVADSTFALYLLHLPFLILIATVLGRRMHWFSAAAVSCIIILACMGFGRLFDELKRALRRWLRRFQTA